MMDNENNPSTGGIDEIDIEAQGAPLEDTPTPAADEVNVSEEGKLDAEFTWPQPTLLENATTDGQEYYKAVDGGWDDLAATIALPADTAARTLNYGQLNPHAAELVDTEAGERWAETISEGLTNGSFQDNLLPAAKREDANWVSHVKSGDTKIAMASPRLGEDTGPLLTGERAVLKINAMMGRGAILQVPLWHSGFFITLKSPGEIELLDTLQTIMDNKVAFGRSSNGLSFANHVVVSQAAIVDLAMRCYYETTVQGFNTIEKIRGAISALDIPLLAWGLACVIYPRGFQFERALLDPNGTQTTVVKEWLNVGTCLRADANSLDEWQVAHMAKRRTGSMTESEVRIYQEHFTRGKPKSVAMNEQVGLTLKVPNVDQYLNAGQRWIDELVASVTQAFTQDLSEKQRNDMIFDRAKATSMRQYVHWIETIDLPTKNQSVKDVESIERVVNSLSSDDAFRDKYYQIIQQYINDSVVSIIGVPQVHPKEADQVKPRFENIIPLDPISVFFNLLYQKIQQIRQRP